MGPVTNLAGETVSLHDQAGQVLATTTTGVDGSYQFSDLPAGAYTFTLWTPSGYANATPALVSATVPLGGLSGPGFGLSTSSISGVVFADANNDDI